MEVFEDKKPTEPAQEDDGMDEEMRQLALEMLERQKEKERASKPKRSAEDVIAAVDASETVAGRSDDELEEQEATYQRGVHRSVSSAPGLKTKKVASKQWKDAEDQIIRDMVANPPRGKDLLSEVESALKIRSIGQIRHRMKILGIDAPQRSRHHRSKSGSSHKKTGSSIPWNDDMDAVIREQFIPEEDQESQLARLVDALLELSSLPERARTILGSSQGAASQKVSRRIRHLGLSKRGETLPKRHSKRAQASDSDRSANSDVSSSSPAAVTVNLSANLQKAVLQKHAQQPRPQMQLMGNFATISWHKLLHQVATLSSQVSCGCVRGSRPRLDKRRAGCA